MIGALRQWLLGVTACALLVSLSEQLCPEGAVRRAARFVGGLLILLAMLRPLSGAAVPEAGKPPDVREALARLEPELEQKRDRALSDGIAAGLDAYIEDKARAMGAEVRADVRLRVREGVPVPERVTLHGAYHEGLSALLETELGLAKEKQQWID